MTRTIFIATLLLLAASSCTQEPKKAERKPQTAEELTRAIIQEVRDVIQSTDEQLTGRQPVSRELPATEEQDAGASLQLWLENDNPVRLIAITGKGQQSNFYFANKALFFVSQNDGQFIFIGPELKYWLDERWAIQQVTETVRKAKEAELKEAADRWLGMLNG